MKKYLLFVLTIMLVCIGLFAVAEDTEPTKYTSGDYEYILLEDGTIEIIKYSSLAKASSVDIPSEIDGYVVSSIGNRAFSTNFVKSVSIPDCVTKMGDNPFSSCTKLNNIYVSPENLYFAVIDNVLFYKPEKKLICFPSGIVQESYEIPQGIKIIGGAAFSWNDCLTSISIPDGVTRIEEGAFQNCFELKKVSIPESVIFLGDYAFSGCELLTVVSISENITEIGSHAFYGCDSLETVYMSDRVSYIGDNAFASCKALAEIDIPMSVTEIGDNAFAWCVSLQNLYIPQTVVKMGVNPFYCCDNLQIELSSENEVFQIIDAALFNTAEMKLVYYPISSSQTTYKIPGGTKIIGDGAFAGCDNLVKIEFSDQIVCIEDYAFSGCGLIEAIVPSNINSIGDYAFCCDGLIRLVLSEGQTSIGKGMCDGCLLLENVNLPKSVTSIGDNAFYACPKLTVTVERDSYAANWCKENGVKYVYPDSLDWLNE